MQLHVLSSEWPLCQHDCFKKHCHKLTFDLVFKAQFYASLLDPACFTFIIYHALRFFFIRHLDLKTPTHWADSHVLVLVRVVRESQLLWSVGVNSNVGTAP